jgi:hypothetical protein
MGDTSTVTSGRPGTLNSPVTLSDFLTLIRRQLGQKTRFMTTHVLSP